MSNRFIVPLILLLLFVLVGLIGLAAVRNSSFFEYEAISLLRVEKSGFENTPTEYEIFKQTQADLISTDLVCNNAIKDPAVANIGWIKNQADPVRHLANAIRVSVPAGAELIQVSLKANNRQDAKDLLDAVVKAYVKISSDSKNKRAADLAVEEDSEILPDVTVLHDAQIVP